MARISKNRNFKIVTSFVMTLVMILSLFAGIGAIFVSEDTSEASASVLDSNGKFVIPEQNTSKQLGTNENPFVVLEIVPNENMAQMGYLVSGQEPVDVNKLEASDAASFIADGERPLTDKMVNDYGWLQWKNGDTPRKSEFANLIPEIGSTDTFYSEDGVDYKLSDMSQVERGDYRQFGYYRLAGKDAEDNYLGSYKMGETVTEVEGIGEGYGYYPEVGVGIAGTDIASLSETELSEIDREQIRKLTGKEFSALVAGTDYVIADNGDIYIKVTEGTGVYSDKIYDRKTYSVTFRVDNKIYKVGGKTYDFNDILAGEKLSADQKPSNPVKEGHTFSFWSTDGPEGTTGFDLNSPITGNIVLDAVWDKETYKVTFDTDGGTVIAPVDVIFDNTVARPDPDPEKEGHTFKGWYADAGKTELYDFSNPIKGNTTVYAKFEINKYTVTFLPGSAGDAATNMPAAQTLEYKQTATEPAKPKWKNHRFKEWRDKDGNKFNFATEIKENIELTAAWDNEYAVTFNANGGIGAPAAQSVVAGDYAERPATVPTFGDLTFGGWYAEGSSTEFDFEHTPINGALELYAKWMCTVEFDSNGGEDVNPKTVLIEYNKTIAESGKVPADPEWDTGHEFLEWHLGSESGAEINFSTYKVTTNITVVAKWKINEYTVTFLSNGQEYAIRKVTPGGKLTDIPNNPTFVNEYEYEFKYWTEDTNASTATAFNLNQTINKNITLRAVYERYYYYDDFPTIKYRNNREYYYTDSTKTNRRYIVEFKYIPFSEVNLGDNQYLTKYSALTLYNETSTGFSALRKGYSSSNGTYTNHYTDIDVDDSLWYWEWSADSGKYAVAFGRAATVSSGNKYFVISKVHDSDVETQYKRDYEYYSYQRGSLGMTFGSFTTASSSNTGYASLDKDGFEIISFASKLFVPEKKPVSTAEVHASGGEETGINTDYYTLNKSIDISTGALPEYVDEEDGKKAGNRNYVRFVIRRKIEAEARYTYKVVKVEAGKEATEGKYEWVGLSFEDNQKVKDAKEQEYLNYYVDKGMTLMTTEEKEAIDAKLNAASVPSPYDKILDYQDVKVYDYYILELQNTDLFKKNALGLAYQDGDILKGKDITGYNFVGWFKDKYGVNSFTNEGITSDVTLYAKWEAVIEGKPSCSVFFNIGDLPEGTVVTGMPATINNINYGATICAPESVPITEGKIFAGWYDSEGNRFEFEKTKLTAQITTLTAHWNTLGTERFSFRFDSNIGTLTGEHIKEGTWPIDIDGVVALNGMKVKEDGTFEAVGEGTPELIKNDNVTASDYAFAGWYLDSECHEKFSFSNSQTTLEKFKDAGISTIVLYARWVKKDSLPNYTVRFMTNEPESAKASATGLNKYIEDGNSIIIQHGKKVTTVKGKRTIKDVQEIKLSLKGNVQDKIEKYVVKVITVTPEDLKDSDNLRLIDRANLIVLSQAFDSDLISLWNKTTTELGAFKNAELFPKANYNLTATSYTGNDLDWNTTLRIMSRITGMKKNNDNSVSNVSTCPVLFDYAIYNSVTGSTSESIKKNLSTKLTFNESTTETKSEAGYTSNVYKLYLMTQQISPATIFNAYIRNNSDVSGSISNTGVFSGGSISGDNTGNYWNRYTLVPWKEISKVDYTGDPSNALAMIGFKNTVDLETGKSKINNRMLMYNATDAVGFAKDFKDIILTVNPDMSDVFGTAAETREYSTADAIYYLINSKTQYDNYNHDLNILDIEPGNNSKSKDYWFWYISRFVPNYTGTTTVTTMSTAEFICNIDDLNSQYDVLYVGADTTIREFGGTGTDGTVSYMPSSKTITPDAATQSYYTSTNNDGSGAAAHNYKLINAVKGMKVNGTYYVVKDVKEVSDSSEYEFRTNETSSDWNTWTAENAFTVTGLYGGSVDIQFDKSKLPEGFRNDVTITVDKPWSADGEYPNPGIGLKKNREDDGYLSNYRRLAYPFSVKINGVSCNVSLVDQSGSNIIYFYKDESNQWRANWGVNFNVSFSYRQKPGTTTRTVYIVESKSSGTVATTGRILIPEGTTIGGNDLIYSHVGEQKQIGDDRANYGIVSATDTSFNQTVYSGNDITFKKYKEIAQFLTSGYPIIISKDLFVAPGSNSINPVLVDTSSWMYKLLNELTSTVTGNPYFWYREDDTSHDASFRKALSNKVFHLVVDSTPPVYKDLTNSDNSHVDEADIYINGHNFNNRTMEFLIKIDAEEPDGKYMLRMFTDTNADGRYDIENEMLDSVQIKDLTSGRSGIAASMVLQSGHNYQVSRTLTEDYTGIIPWKLQVLEVEGTRNTPTGVYDDQTGMAAIKVTKKEQLYVLQITSENDANTGTNQLKTNVFFPTDQEISKAYAKRGAAISATNHKSDYFSVTGLTVGYNKDIDIASDTWNNAQIKKNMSEFYYYTYLLKEFDVHFLRVSLKKRNDSDTRTSLYDIAHSNAVIGSTLTWDSSQSKFVTDKEEVRWSDINMLILGYADCYNDITDPESLEMIKDFIEGGKTTLFTHDTTSPVNRQVNTTTYYQKWGYKINEYFRDFLGMDRYGVMKYKHQTATASNVGTVAAASLGSGNDFENIGIANANDFNIEYDVPFAPNKTMDLFNGTDVRSDNLAKSSNTMLIQGLNNRIVNSGDNNTMKKVTQNNSGQIVVYPYTVGSIDDDYSIAVGETHSQYYQLNMEDDEIVVWYSVYKKGQGYQNVVNDGSNNYYIYNKGNITYSGVGHQAELTEEEYKLFVNTMIAAYNSRVRATEPIVRNSDKSTDSANGKDYIYVDFDATVSEENSTVPVGGDIEKKTASNGTVYYTKKVEFELRNYSIIMNKFMTVHFYPVVYDKDTGKRVVLYDYPIPLEVKKVDGGTVSKCTATWTQAQIEACMGKAPTGGERNYSNMLFAYKMPNGKIGKTELERAKENYEIVGVAKDSVYEVESLEQYYVEIPISNSYYKSVLNLPDRYDYYVDEAAGNSGSKTWLYSKGNSYGVSDADADYDMNSFGIDKQNSFEIEIQVVMRFGRDQTRNMPYVGTRGIIFLRRGMFTLD